jgi:energy-coupling factor transport system permease protein
MATAASRTTNPLLLGLIIAVVALVVSARRSDAPWAKGFGAYLVMGLVIVAMRVVFRMLLDGQHGAHVLFTLPELPLPDAAAGIRIGGPVSLEGLANPKRLLKSVPSALYEVGSAVTVALTVAPQLVESGRRVLRARRLRGDAGRRTRWFHQIVLPVMTDALDRSLMLAAAMDSRGYGRTEDLSPATRRLTAVLVLTGMAGVCVGTYGLLDASTPGLLGLPALVAGLLLASVGFGTSRRRTHRTRYRPDPWRAAEWGVVASGVTVAVALIAVSAADSALLNPPLQPLEWPQLPLVPTLAVLLGALPAVLAPPPMRWESDGTDRDRVPTSALRDRPEVVTA